MGPLGPSRNLVISSAVDPKSEVFDCISVLIEDMLKMPEANL